MLPYMKGDSVIVPDRSTASTLINKGSFGKPLSGGGLELSLVEAAYLTGEERLEVKRSRKGRLADHGEILTRGMASSERFMENYLVFSDIRNRGMNIQGDGQRTFMTYPRGQGPGRGRADSWIMVFREHDRVDIPGLFNESVKREGMRMGLLAAVVDGDFDITYYSVSRTLFEGSGSDGTSSVELTPEEGREVPGGGMLLFGGDLEKRARSEGLGTDISGNLALSKEEGSYLTGVEDPEESETLKEKVYRDLKGRGFIVRTGFKYGSHFRIYTSGSIEDHSDLLVHCILPVDVQTWEGLARAIRLSHSVRKRMLFAFSTGNIGVSYLELGWTRP